MPVFDTFQVLGKHKNYETVVYTRVSESNSSEANPIRSAHKSNTDTESQTRILSQEGVE